MKRIEDKDLLNHFWNHVLILGEDDCWEWQGSFRTNGYGKFYIHRKCYNAQRALWILLYKEIHPKLEVCHTCDNKKCVNPNHLFLGTHKKNMEDAYQKGIVKNPPILYGKDNSASKLNEVSVRKIFELYRYGWTKTAISRRFGVTKQAIGAVLNRTSWAWVELYND